MLIVVITCFNKNISRLWRKLKIADFIFGCQRMQRTRTASTWAIQFKKLILVLVETREIFETIYITYIQQNGLEEDKVETWSI